MWSILANHTVFRGTWTRVDTCGTFKYTHTDWTYCPKMQLKFFLVRLIIPKLENDDIVYCYCTVCLSVLVSLTTSPPSLVIAIPGGTEHGEHGRASGRTPLAHKTTKIHNTNRLNRSKRPNTNYSCETTDTGPNTKDRSQST